MIRLITYKSKMNSTDLILIILLKNVLYLVLLLLAEKKNVLKT